MLKTNVGTIDRLLRIALGIALLVAFFMSNGMGYSWLFALFGAVALLTGLLKTCPAYTVLGVSTCTMKKS
ncbi:MAG: hypothetical protein ACJASV_001370 [Pseudorhodobacter sp.]|jgi:hypothetical protein